MLWLPDGEQVVSCLCCLPTSTCCAQKRILIGGTATAAGLVAAYRNDLTQLQFDTFSAFGPFLRLLDAESSHSVAVWTAKYGIVPTDRRPDITSLGVSVWGREFPNPIGKSAFGTLTMRHTV